MFERIFGKGIISATVLQEIIVAKELAYQDVFRPHLKLISGLDSLQTAFITH